MCGNNMNIGDIVIRKSYDGDIKFKVVDIKIENAEEIYVLKGTSVRIIADSREDDLEVVEEDYQGEQEKILNKRVCRAINNAINYRQENNINIVSNQKKNRNELVFGRPGKILHIDGDSEYMENCLKVYKQLNLDAIGRTIPESKQPKVVVSLVKEYKPDIVVITGHDSISKKTQDYLDINCYRNSKYYIDSIKALRNYNSSYDELVIFAGACQSCYEAILDAGANFASSPGRVLIHCLDPVFVCEKIA